MVRLSGVFVFFLILFGPSASRQSAKDDWAEDDWAEAVLLSIDPSTTQREIDERFQEAICLSERKADILMC